MNVFEHILKEPTIGNLKLKSQLIEYNLVSENGFINYGLSVERLEKFFKGKPLEFFHEEKKIYIRFSYFKGNIKKTESNFSFAERQKIRAENKKENPNKRNENILVRVNQNEKEKIQKKAEKFNLGVSEYMREMAQYGRVNILSSEEKMNLTRIGINFNQFVKLWTSTGRQPLEIENEFRELLDYLKKCYNK